MAAASLVAEIRGAADSGRAVLGQLGEPQTAFATRPFWSGSVEDEWVAAPGTRGDGVLLYLHDQRFQFDEPPGVYAARLPAATRLPVLLLRYRLAPQHPYPAALDDVTEAYRALLGQGTPADKIVLPGHSAGATLALLALRDDSVRFADWAAAGVAAILEMFEGMPHGFPVLPLDASQSLLGSTARFTAERLTGISGEPSGPLSIL